MSAERITGADIRTKHHPLGVAGEWWKLTNLDLDSLAYQVEADAQRLAEVEKQVTEAKAETQRLWSEGVFRAGGVRCTWCGFICSIEAQGREHTKSCSANPLVAENAALRADAAEWRALQAVIASKNRDHGPDALVRHVAGYHGDDCEVVAFVKGARVSAPTPTALLAKLDALAEAAKPKPETWRWMIGGTLEIKPFTTAAECRKVDGWGNRAGHPVREVRNQDGDVLLLREGRPVPEGFA